MRSIVFTGTNFPEPLTQLMAVFPVTVLLREMIRQTEKWSQDVGNAAQATPFLQAMQDLLPEEIENYLPSTTNHRLLPTSK
jgi:hypothetical protein